MNEKVYAMKKILVIFLCSVAGLNMALRCAQTESSDWVAHKSTQTHYQPTLVGPEWQVRRVFTPAPSTPNRAPAQQPTPTGWRGWLLKMLGDQSLEAQDQQEEAQLANQRAEWAKQREKLEFYKRSRGIRTVPSRLAKGVRDVSPNLIIPDGATHAEKAALILHKYNTESGEST